MHHKMMHLLRQAQVHKHEGAQRAECYLQAPEVSVAAKAGAFPASLQQPPQLPLCLLAPHDHHRQPARSHHHA